MLLNANIKAIEILDAAAAANFETEYQRAIEVSTGIEATAKLRLRKQQQPVESLQRRMVLPMSLS